MSKIDLSRLNLKLVKAVLDVTLAYREGLIKAGLPNEEVLSLTIAFQGSMMIPLLLGEEDAWEK